MKKVVSLSALLVATVGAVPAQGQGGPVDLKQVRSQVVAVLDGWIDRFLDDQNLDADDVRHGQFHQSDNMRLQECTQLIAWAYIQPDSRHFQNPRARDGAVWSIDYMVRAQGDNGGFNEYHGWCGAPERTKGKSSVTGFTMYAIARAVVILTPLPEMRERLQEPIDTDGRNGPDRPRVDAWRRMLQAAMDNLYSGTGRGHAANQDLCALAAVFAVQEAWEVLSPDAPPLKTSAEVAALRDEIFFGHPAAAAHKGIAKWFTEAGLPIEEGKGFSGYDANYAQVSLAFLGLCARRDPEATAFLGKCWSALEHFFIPDPDSPVGFSMENATSRRVNGALSRLPGLCMLAHGTSAHPAGERMYATVLEGFSRDVPERMKLKSPHHFQISSYLYTEWLDHMTAPKRTDYRLPAERPGPWEWRDEEARILVRKSTEGGLSYYVEHWEQYHQARRVVWGHEPEVVPCTGHF